MLLLKGISLSDYDEWHKDETIIFIDSKHHYLWLVIDPGSRLIISYNLSSYRDT